MEALLKKYFWIVKVLGLAVVVGLAASAVTTKVGAAKIFITADDESGDGGDTDGESDTDTDGDEDDEPKSPGAGIFDASKTKKRTGTDERQRTASEKAKMLTTLLANNLFCPTCAPEVPEEPEDADVGAPILNEDGEQIGGIQPGEQRTSLPFKLVVTMESSEPKYSQATIFDTEEGSVSPYWPGDQVRPGVYLVAVERGLIHLQNQSSLEYLELGAEIAPPKKKAKKKEEAPAKPKKGAIPGADEAIKCDSENSCTIERAFVEQILSNPAALAKQARVVPSVVDGETRGFKFYGIRSGSLPKLLGLKNGDLITSVNGKDLKSMDDAMALYTKLRNAPNLSINVDRKGAQMTKEITIQ